MTFAVVAGLGFLKRLPPSLQVSALLRNICTPGPQDVVIILRTQRLEGHANELREALEVFGPSALEARVLE